MIRVLVWIFGIWAIYSIYSKFSKKEITWLMFAFWFFLIAAIIGVVSHAYIADIIANYFGLGEGRGVEFALFLAILVALYLIFRLYLNIGRIETQISEIVKNIALINVKKRRRKKK